MLILSTARRFIFLVCLISAIALGADENSTAIQSLVQAERDFAQASADHGIRASFLRFLGDTCTVFTPEPTNGKKFYSAYSAQSGELSWRPVFAAVSQGGDLGCTTGPWNFKKSPGASEPLEFGQFASIWKVQPDGTWKVIIDMGVDHPSPSNKPEVLELLAPESNWPPSHVTGFSALVSAQRELYDGLAGSDSTALLLVAHEKIRVLRSGNEPAIGKEAVGRLLSSQQVRSQRQQILEDISQSRDLAYEYGTYSGLFGDKAHGYFLSVLRSDALGNWKLVLDVQKQVQKPNDSG